MLTGYYWPQLGKPVETGLIVLLVATLLWQWRKLPGLTAVSDTFLVIISLSLIVANIIVVRTATTNYIVMYLPLLLLLREVSQRVRWGRVWVACFLLLSTVGMWLLFLTTIEGDLEHPVTYLPLPIVVLVGLWLWRDWRSPATISCSIAFFQVDGIGHGFAANGHIQ